MMEPTVALLMAKVIPAARNYHEAEYALTFAFNRYYDESRCRSEADTAKRRATEVAIEIDGLADRAARALGLTADIVRSQVGQMSAIRGVPRDRCVDRVRSRAPVQCCNSTRSIHLYPSEAEAVAVRSGQVGRFRIRLLLGPVPSRGPV